MKDLRISVFGLGKLGCTMLACFAEKGWSVIGVDVAEEVVNKVNSGNSPIYEPGVQELISTNRDKIRATMDSEDAISNSDISFVIVPTPSTDDGSFSIKYVEIAVAEIGSILRSKKDYHTVVITSTVLPGNMTDLVKFLEKTSGKRCTADFGVCYNPDFIALGNVVHDFLNPDMILIGESDKNCGDILESIHLNMVENKPRVHRMNFHNAELSKISLNSFCTLKISFANTLAEICEKMPGGDADAVTAAIGDDERIGRKYIKGGLSYGGPCFPRDNRAFAFTASRYGVDRTFARFTDQLNRYHKEERIPSLILKILEKQGSSNLSILGTTYKKDTQLTEESAAIAVIQTLLKSNIQIKIYDPGGMEMTREDLGHVNNIMYVGSPVDCIKNTSACFIATPWDELKELTAEDFTRNMHDPVILDAWDLYNFSEDDGIKYIRIGHEINL